MTLCLAAGAIAATLAVDSFTLAWTHSIEKIRWEEDWRIEEGKLRVVAARVRGAGAGMEPPPGAVLKDGVWHYVPALPMLPRLALRHTPHVPAHEVCAGDRCRSLPDWLPGLPADAVIEFIPCQEPPK